MGSYNRTCLHLVWATKFRQPLITPVVREIVYGTFRAECEAMDTELLAVGGIEDHVHLLVRLHVSVPVADFVRRLKGLSSYRVTAVTGNAFRWQGGYAVFTVSRFGVAKVRAYIENQERHHRRR